MIELIEGKIYRCEDGEVRRLDKIEHKLLHYSVPVGDKGRVHWMRLSGTRRSAVEADFVKGEFIEESEII